MSPKIELNPKKRYFQVENSDGAEWFLNQENIMNQKILANFNLNQSLEEFQVSILELLQLNNVTEWSGKTIKERAEKIRETALILAGQCVAIL